MRVYRGSRGFSIGPVGILIAFNLVLFLVALVRPTLIFTFGLRPELFLQRPWTIITSMFLHGGFGHIFANMITLYFFGSYLNRLIGDRNFLIIYFGGGILGSLVFILLGPSNAIAVGASGAVFALGGALTVLRPKMRVFIFPIPAPLPLWVAVIGGFLIMSFLPGVAWQAHLGGLVFGAAMAFLFRRRRYFY
jgi:membrane associated rhomboid family serine protease